MNEGGSKPRRSISGESPTIGEGGFEQTFVREPTTENPVPVEAALHDPDAMGLRYGRYVILNRIAAGGMGEVYAAWDPRLDRKVALKILRADLLKDIGVSHGRSRLLREAQAMAKLSHPNIVAVHDVGVEGDEIFIAMEFVDGQPLREWSDSRQQPVEDVLRVFIEAGKGLLAAHQAGLVHRDFKPLNVIVTPKGRVCVLDFGIARSQDAPDPITDPSPTKGPHPTTGSKSAPGQKPLETLTIAGSVVGTPGYMSPEQYRGENVDARTDQYSFCIALYEALYGTRPWVGDTLEALQKLSERAQLAFPEDKPVPRFVQAILRKGLSPRRDDRFASMAELLTALQHSPRQARKRKLFIALGATACLLAGAGLTVAKVMQPPPCPSAAGRWDDVWSPVRKAQIEKSFYASKQPFAKATAREVAALIERYRTDWLDAEKTACEATHVRHEQSAELLDRRAACLTRRLDEARAVTDVLTQADAETVGNAVSMVSALQPMSTCAADVILSSAIVLPTSEIASQVAAARKSLAVATALINSAHRTDADPLLKKLAQDSASLGYAPLRAEVATALSQREKDDGHLPEAKKWAHDALLYSVEANYFDVAAHALAVLATIEGDSESRHEDGMRRLQLALAMFNKGSHTAVLEGDIENAFAAVNLDEGDYAAALEHRKRALALLTRAYGEDSPQAARELSELAWTESWSGDQQRAAEHNRKALALVEKLFGEQHPVTAQVLSRLGSIEDELGEYESALQHHNRAVDIYAQVVGPNTFEVATSLNNMAVSYFHAGKPADCIATAVRGISVDRQNGMSNPRLSSDMETLGSCQLALKQAKEAERTYGDALALVRGTLPSDHLELAYLYTGAGEAQLLLGRPKEALRWLEQAMKIREGRESLREEVGRTRAAYAVALLDTGNKKLALEQAHKATDDLSRAGRYGMQSLDRMRQAFAGARVKLVE